MKCRKVGVLGVALFTLCGCATTPPANPNSLCAIFSEKPEWYADAAAAQARWGAPIALQMAILRHESSYREDAQPPRDTLLGFIPWFRSSSAYGYAQAQDTTWEWYQSKSGNRGADRDDFGDATDFVAWYLHQSHRMLGISRGDAYRQYLAYHEGQGGYKRGSYRDKPKLLRYAKRVAETAARYGRQLDSCGTRLAARGESRWWPF